MALTGNQRALTVARFGAARFGAARFGFTPKDTKGPLYAWRRRYLPTQTWTAHKR
jgi:hypothetical protein